MRIGELELQDGVAPAQWIVDAIHPFAQDVGSLVPDRFKAYARIFHPAGYITSEERRVVRWAEIAAANDRVVHPEMQFPNLTGGRPHGDDSTGEPVWNHEPDCGCLPKDAAATLSAVLSRFTASREHCWFCVWEGFGGSKLPDENPHKVELPQRRYHLLGGPIGGINETFQLPVYSTRSRGSQMLTRRRVPRLKRDPVRRRSRGWRGFEPPQSPTDRPVFEPWQSANLWWPDDRAWFVATEIDFTSTYIGGSRACIDALLAAPDLEVLETQVDHGITYASDRINPPPDEPSR